MWEVWNQTRCGSKVTLKISITSSVFNSEMILLILNSVFLTVSFSKMSFSACSIDSVDICYEKIEMKYLFLCLVLCSFAIVQSHEFKGFTLKFLLQILNGDFTSLKSRKDRVETKLKNIKSNYLGDFF